MQCHSLRSVEQRVQRFQRLLGTAILQQAQAQPPAAGQRQQQDERQRSPNKGQLDARKRPEERLRQLGRGGSSCGCLDSRSTCNEQASRRPHVERKNKRARWDAASVPAPGCRWPQQTRAPGAARSPRASQAPSCGSKALHRAVADSRRRILTRSSVGVRERAGKNECSSCFRMLAGSTIQVPLVEKRASPIAHLARNTMLCS